MDPSGRCYAMGIRTGYVYLSTTLWFSGRNPIEQCTAFLARAQAVFVVMLLQLRALRTLRNGNVIYEHKDNPVQAIGPAVAAAATDVLSGVLTSGTGRYAWPEDLQPARLQVRRNLLPITPRTFGSAPILHSLQRSCLVDIG